VILLDAYALLAYLRDEPAAGAVESLLRGGDCVLDTVNLAEVLDQLIRVDRLEGSEVAESLSGLIGGPIVVSAADEPVAWRAAAIRARHYRRKDSDLSLADCILIASAGPDDTIATADAAIARAARTEGIELRRLSDRQR
jgi:PIN domain nuclease of toxin-antitoxin system